MWRPLDIAFDGIGSRATPATKATNAAINSRRLRSPESGSNLRPPNCAPAWRLSRTLGRSALASRSSSLPLPRSANDRAFARVPLSGSVEGGLHAQAAPDDGEQLGRQVR